MPICGNIAGGDASATRKTLVLAPYQGYIVDARLALEGAIAADADSWTIQVLVGAEVLASVSLTEGLGAETSLALTLEAAVDIAAGDVLRVQAIPDDGVESPDLPNLAFTLGVTAR